MPKIKVSAVSYLNSSPFIYGLKHSEILDEIDLSLDIPSICAKKTVEGTVDIGLVPVAVIPELKEAYIIGDHCIGAVGKVGSVMLFSQVELKDIKNVLLDGQSRTSVVLAKILAKHYWKIEPKWIQPEKDLQSEIKDSTAGVMIGDRTFGLTDNYKYCYDLAEEWQRFTGLPFVFACWVANKQLPGDFIERFNMAIKKGVEARPELIRELRSENKYPIDVEEYLNQSISYSFDQPKKEALKLFLHYQKAVE